MYMPDLYLGLTCLWDCRDDQLQNLAALLFCEAQIPEFTALFSLGPNPYSYPVDHSAEDLHPTST